jgi:hypothetical protein
MNGSRFAKGTALLVILLAISEAGYLILLRLDAVNGFEPVARFLSVLGGLFIFYALACRQIAKGAGSARQRLLIVAVGAVLFRLTLLPAGLPHDASPRELLQDLRADVRGEAVTYERFQLYDDDVWRYLWDGHVWAHGVNPYRYAPTDSRLDNLADDESGGSLWSDIRANLSYPSVPTLYPPLAQMIFRLSDALAPGSVLVIKAMMAALDLIAALFVALALRATGRAAEGVILYAWNPLVIKVFAGSGHIDALVAATLAALAYFVLRGAKYKAAAAFGLAVLAKLSPLVLLPFVARRIGVRALLVSGALVLAGYAPFLSAGRNLLRGLMVFARAWQFNAGPFDLLRWSAERFSGSADLAARVLSGLLILGLVAWLAWRDDGRTLSFAPLAAAAFGALIVLSPMVAPWYVAALLVLAVAGDERVWIYFSALVCLAFLVMVDQKEHAVVLLLEYGALTALVWHRAWRPHSEIRHEADL